MKIGITGLTVDKRNSECLDLIKYIKARGHRAEVIGSDALETRFSKGKVEVYQTVPRPSGGGADNTKVKVDALLLRHLGIMRDYEQFAYRLWCIRAFELNEILTMNSLSSWVTASDKLGALIYLAKKGISVPETVVTESMFGAYDATKKFKTSVIKPLRSAMGFGVFRVSDPDVAMHAFSYFTNMNKPIYVQRYLKKKGNGDYRVIVVGNDVIGAEFRKGTGWKSNVAQGGVPQRCKIDAEMKELAIKTAETLKLEYVGVDIAEAEGKYYVIETNPTIAWRGFLKVTGINPAKYIVSRLFEKLKN